VTVDEGISMDTALLFDEKLEPLRELCRTYAVERLEVFGSAADSSFDPQRSDLDFLVTFAPCMPSPSTSVTPQENFIKNPGSSRSVRVFMKCDHT
jgi:predicted nucleotidyltransferase